MFTGRSVSFVVRGVPVPQGSVTAHVGKRKDGTHYASVHYAVGSKLHGWRHSISREAGSAWGDGLAFGPIGLRLTFYMKRPLAQYRNLQGGIKVAYLNAVPDVAPDLDKLVRAVCDALTDVVYDDDSQVVILEASKVYGEPGVQVEVWECA